MSETRYLMTLSVLSAGAGLVSGTLLLLQATTVWVSPPTHSAPAAIQSESAPSDTDAVTGSVAAILHEITPQPEENFSPASLDEPAYTAAVPAEAESAEDTPLASHESEISPPQPRGVSTSGAEDATEDATEVAANPPAQEVPHHRTEAQATDTNEVSEPIKQAGDAPSANINQRPVDSDQARAGEPVGSMEPASSPSPSERPAPKRVVQADKHELAVKAKPQWKPMALAPNEKLAQPAKLSSASYDSKVWAALARHKPRTTQRQSASVTFAIAASGRVRFVKVTGSSGDSRLDKLAIATVRKAAPFPPPPTGSPSYTIRIYVR